MLPQVIPYDHRPDSCVAWCAAIHSKTGTILGSLSFSCPHLGFCSAGCAGIIRSGLVQHASMNTQRCRQPSTFFPDFKRMMHPPSP